MISIHQENATGHTVQSYRSPHEIHELVGLLEKELAAAGYTEKDIFAVKLALEEALINAIKHGHKYDLSKRASFRYEVTRERVVLEVEDEGPGFDPEQVPDPLAEGNIEKASGRGLFLMRAYMTSVCYNNSGNRVTMSRQRSRS